MVAGPVSEGLSADFQVSRSEGFVLSLTLDIAAGKTVALLGPNGAGKSTAVSAISGLLPIDSGQIELATTILDSPERGVFVAAEERSVGVVFQDYLLFPHLTVLENVSFGLRSRGVSAAEAGDRSRSWLGKLDLDGLEKRRPGDLSGGQAQRVALARALVTEPALLLLDEPLAALDVTTRTELRHVLDDHLEAFDGPKLLITHEPTEAFLLADEIHIIQEGSVTQSGTADEIRLRPRTHYAADLAGYNLVTGVAHEGVVETGSHALRIADEAIEGPVVATIHPTAISVHPSRPEGSQRNSWETTVERVEQLGPRVRLRTGSPLPLTLEVTDSARSDLALEPGCRVWVAFKATEILVLPDTV
jgi:molybdate transport system ATP-binding protein